MKKIEEVSKEKNKIKYHHVKKGKVKESEWLMQMKKKYALLSLRLFESKEK